MSTFTVNPKIEESWKRILINEFKADYFADLKAFLLAEKEKYTVRYVKCRRYIVAEQILRRIMPRRNISQVENAI